MASQRRYLKISKNGIQVCIPRLDVTRRFSLTTSRTFEAALAAALDYRDGVLKEHGQLSLLNNLPHLKPKTGNSPMAGVYLSIQERDAGQKPKACFSALYTKADGRPGKKTFGIVKLGSYAKAFRKAAAFRCEMCNLAVDSSELPVPRPTIVQYLIIKNLVDDIPASRY